MRVYQRDDVGVEENSELDGEENGWWGDLDGGERSSSTAVKELDEERWREGESKRHREDQLKKLLRFEWKNWTAYIYSISFSDKNFLSQKIPVFCYTISHNIIFITVAHF